MVALAELYSRKQAIESGALVDLTPMAEQVGIELPVAATYLVWSRLMVPADEEESYQESEARLWVTLDELKGTIDGFGRSRPSWFRSILAVTTKQKMQLVKAICEPGDEQQPAITLMLPEED